MHYRLYFLDSHNSIVDAIGVECDTDEQAVAVAREKTDGRIIEIWQRNRRLGIFEPSEPATAS
jgi:hypothetical protein